MMLMLLLSEGEEEPTYNYEKFNFTTDEVEKTDERSSRSRRKN
jgi:hypothetical protein